MSYEPTRILIAGAGFGGIYTYKHLHKHLHSQRDVQINILNKENYFLFTPLLHEVATGSIAPANIIEPIRHIARCCTHDFHFGEITSISLSNKTVKTAEETIDYDYLVLALGSEPHFHGIPGAKDYSFPLKNIQDAVRLKRQFLDVFEQATKIDDAKMRQQLLRFVVIGGGATGVELAAEIAELFHGTLKRYFACEEMIHDVEIILLQRQSELLLPFSEVSRKKSLATLTKKSVQVRFDVWATEITEEGVRFNTGEFLQTKTPIWTAGVKPKNILFDEEIAKDQNGRLIVDTSLRLSTHLNVFVLGDLASFEQKMSGQPLPTMAQVATQEAVCVANNIQRLLEGKPPVPFVYHHKGNLVSLGHWVAIAEIGPLKFFGPLAWWLWRTIYLTKFISTKKKFEIALDWTLNLFSPRDIS